MKELLVLKIICVLAGQGSLHCVSTQEILFESGLSKGKFYSAINKLIEFGYIKRVMRGWYIPSTWYQNTLWEGEING